MSSSKKINIALTSPQRRPTILGADFSPFSKSPGHLQEVTFDPNFSSSCQSPVQGSPAQARTMKDYEEQLSTLRKENFNLKLKVYFLEERLYASNAHAPQDNLLQKNIDLKITLEGLQRDLNEKQELLCEAARALELMESSAARKEAELLSQISAMEDELHAVRTSAEDDDATIPPNVNNVTGVDDSIALYSAAFNLNPTLFDKKKEAPKSCECRQLTALLTIEKENVATLRDKVAARDTIITEQKQQIQDLEEKKTAEVDKPSSVEKPDDEHKTLNLESMDGPQLERLQQENLNACQMIQGCLTRIKQMDRENKKIKKALIEKEEIITKLQNDAGSQDDNLAVVKKYKEMLDVRDSKITELESQLKNVSALRELDNSKMSSFNDDKELNWVNSHLEQKINTLRESICPKAATKDTKAEVNKDNTNIQEMLVKRLQELGYFLDSLLSHRCILGEEKRRKVENLLEQTMELPVGLELDKHASRLLEETFLDVSFGKLPDNVKLGDITALFGHHTSMNDSSRAKTNEKNNDRTATMTALINQQELMIKNLNKQIENMKEICTCARLDYTTDDNLSSDRNLNEKSTGRTKHKNSKRAKFPPNSTWNGFEGFRVDHSESECWSEPDRNVSRARMGPLDNSVKETVSSEEDNYTQFTNRSNMQKSTDNENKLSEYKDEIKTLISEKIRIEKSLEEANARILSLENNLEANNILHASEIKNKQNEINALIKKLDESDGNLRQQIEKYNEVVKQLNTERDSSKAELNAKLLEFANERRMLEQQQIILRQEINQITESSNSKLKEFHDKLESDWVTKSRYEALRRELDNAVLQASQATLDRAMASEQKVRSDAETERLRLMLKEEQLRISELENVNAELQNRLVRMETWRTTSRALSSSGHASDSSPQATSPDQSIEGDRLSLMELIETVPSTDKYNLKDLATENMVLRKKLEHTQKALERTMEQLKNPSYPQNIQRAVCQEIHKTQSILRQVRDNLNNS